MDPFDLNAVFTKEGRQAIFDEALATPPDAWSPDGQAPGSVAQPVMQPTPSQPEQQPQGQEYDPRSDPKFATVASMLQGVFQRNQQLEQFYQTTQLSMEQQQEQAFLMRLQQLSEAGTPEAAREAIQLTQERANQKIIAAQSMAQTAVTQAQAGQYAALVAGYTNEIFAAYPSLTDDERDLLQTIENPDQRARWAAHFDQQHQQSRNLAANQGAAIHAASGAGRVGGAAPAGASDGGQPRLGSVEDVVRSTPWIQASGAYRQG